MFDKCYHSIAVWLNVADANSHKNRNGIQSFKTRSSNIWNVQNRNTNTQSENIWCNIDTRRIYTTGVNENEIQCIQLARLLLKNSKVES